MAERNATRLPIIFCLLVDFPENKIDCGPASSSNETICFSCPNPGKFLSGGILEDHNSLGHAICSMIWIFILLVGTFGACANCLIIIVIKGHREPRAFDTLLSVLASFDLASSITGMISSTAMVVFYGTWAQTSVKIH